tara:strand:- start:3337 stop:3975 length:639 start_codon:yes stop_codon:yes gene_type:complete
MTGLCQIRIHKDSLRNIDDSKYWKPDAKKKYNGILFTGIAFDIDNNEAIIYECSYLNGEKSGLERNWWHGYVEFTTYVKGKKTGLSRGYNRYEGWKDDFYINDSLISSYNYDKNGNKYIYIQRCYSKGNYPSFMNKTVPLEKFGYNGNCVSGDCVNGFGRKIYDNGMIYNGNFKNNLRSGLGELFLHNDTIYGKWMSDFSVKVCDLEYSKNK